MASKDVFEKILTGIGLDNSVDDAEYVDDYDEEIEYEDEIKEEPQRAPKKVKPKFVPTRRTGGRAEKGDEMYNIHRMHAKTIEDGKQITEYLKNKTTVIINLEGVDLAVAQRIIDYYLRFLLRIGCQTGKHFFLHLHGISEYRECYRRYGQRELKQLGCSGFR